jgi:hypothetical protein
MVERSEPEAAFVNRPNDGLSIGAFMRSVEQFAADRGIGNLDDVHMLIEINGFHYTLGTFVAYSRVGDYEEIVVHSAEREDPHVP